MEEKVLTIEFSGNIKVKAKTFEEASDIFWEWVMGSNRKNYIG